jgi:hypothetical protein
VDTRGPVQLQDRGGGNDAWGAEAAAAAIKGRRRGRACLFFINRKQPILHTSEDQTDLKRIRRCQVGHKINAFAWSNHSSSILGSLVLLGDVLAYYWV